MITRTLRSFCAAAFISLAVPLLATSDDSRAAFLHLLERPRVPLAPDVSAPAIDDNGLTRITFSFASESSQRVPGILLKSPPASAASSAARRPVVIALHGTGGSKESQLPLLTDLARAGFIAIAIDGRYHGARSKAGRGAADYNEAILRTFRTASSSPPSNPAASNSAREYPFFFDTAWDVMRLIDYLATRDDVDASRIGLIGFSKGGIETYLAAAADPRIAVAIPCIGVQSFRWALENDAWHSRVETVQTAFDLAAKESNVPAPDAAFVRTFYDRVAPGIYREFDGPAMLPLIAPRALLIINGEVDARTPLPGLTECADAARAAYKSAGAENKFVQHIQPKAGHTVTLASMQLAQAWLMYWLKP